MVKLVDIPVLKELMKKEGIKEFLVQLTDRLESDFKRWPEFSKSPRHATHYPEGVLELMPTADNKRYAFKYVNGHPKNTEHGQLCVTGVGMLVEVDNGYPLMISEMTLLTALRTAATSALAARHLKHREYEEIAMIGAGAQSEFQVLAMAATLPLKRVKYFDIDSKAMQKFAKNLQGYDLELLPCTSAQEAVKDVGLVITATAAKRKQAVLESAWIKPGTVILGIGGDCPGKTVLPEDLLERCKIFAEHKEQTVIEGELQHLGLEGLYAELWQIICGDKKAHADDDDVLLFDSVGFAIEDFSALCLIYDLIMKHKVGINLDLIPAPADPKNLFAELV